MLAAFLNEKSYFDERPHYFAEKSDVKSEPRNGDKPILFEGTKVFVFETIGRWKNTTDGTEGWIDSSAIGN
jgi:hypothetical protein